MPMLANRVWAWVHRGTSSDRRTGFVEMSDAEARNAIVGGRAQDPMVGALKLKHIDYTVPGAGRAASPPPPEPKPEPEPEPDDPPPEPTPEQVDEPVVVPPPPPTATLRRRPGR